MGGACLAGGIPGSGAAALPDSGRPTLRPGPPGLVVSLELRLGLLIQGGSKAAGTIAARQPLAGAVVRGRFSIVDERYIEQVLTETGRARRRLSLTDVVNAGLPAVYSQFGEQLLFMDGRIYDASDPSLLTEVPIAATGESDETVGLEFGWQHAGDCPVASARTSGRRRTHT